MFRKVIASKMFTNGNASHIRRVPLNEGKKAESLSPEFHRIQLVYYLTNMATLIEYMTNTQVSNFVTYVQVRGDFPNRFTLYSHCHNAGTEKPYILVP